MANDIDDRRRTIAISNQQARGDSIITGRVLTVMITSTILTFIILSVVYSILRKA